MRFFQRKTQNFWPSACALHDTKELMRLESELFECRTIESCRTALTENRLVKFNKTHPLPVLVRRLVCGEQRPALRPSRHSERERRFECKPI
jgi:hypothetical protein